MALIRSPNQHRDLLGARPANEEHALRAADPRLAGMVDRAWAEHCVHTTRRNYASPTHNYSSFCTSKGLQPWPASDYKVAAWLLDISTHVRYTSMRTYLSALRDRQLSLGLDWSISSSERIRRTLRYIKRAFPCAAIALKFAITLIVLRAILPHLPGWPDLPRMHHNDRAFATASISATSGFLRGGEFLACPTSCRPLLRIQAINVHLLKSCPTLVISIPQPKTKWWLPSVDVPCYGSGEISDPFDPTTLWQAYISLSPAVQSLRSDQAGIARLPAFHFSDGSPLTREFMLSRTKALCAQAGIDMLGPNGTAQPLKAASWRAGGVETAKQAGLSESMIMFMGRWTSNAWRHYLTHTPVDVQSAAHLMWASKALVPAQAGLKNGPTVGTIPSLITLDEECMAAIRAKISALISPTSVARAASFSRDFNRVKLLASRKRGRI
jgi:hypothetical protein